MYKVELKKYLTASNQLHKMLHTSKFSSVLCGVKLYLAILNCYSNVLHAFTKLRNKQQSSMFPKNTNQCEITGVKVSPNAQINSKTYSNTSNK